MIRLFMVKYYDKNSTLKCLIDMGTNIDLRFLLEHPEHLMSFCQVPSSPFLKMSYFTSKDKTPASTNWRENDMIFGSAKR